MEKNKTNDFSPECIERAEKLFEEYKKESDELMERHQYESAGRDGLFTTEHRELRERYKNKFIQLNREYNIEPQTDISEKKVTKPKSYEEQLDDILGILKQADN